MDGPCGGLIALIKHQGDDRSTTKQPNTKQPNTQQQPHTACTVLGSASRGRTLAARGPMPMMRMGSDVDAAEAARLPGLADAPRGDAAQLGLSTCRWDRPPGGAQPVWRPHTAWRCLLVNGSGSCVTRLVVAMVPKQWRQWCVVLVRLCMWSRVGKARC